MNGDSPRWRCKQSSPVVSFLIWSRYLFPRACVLISSSLDLIFHRAVVIVVRPSASSSAHRYPPPIKMSWQQVTQTTLVSSTMFCSRCGEGFEENEQIVNSGGEVWHQSCFVCSQCFQSFGPEGIFYEFEGRKYCEHDFNVLYAPSCQKCGQFIVGRVIKALGVSWHPLCFQCAVCNISLADMGFIKNAGMYISLRLGWLLIP